MKNPLESLGVLVIDMQAFFANKLRDGALERITRYQTDVLAQCKELGIRVWAVEITGHTRTIAPIRTAIESVPRNGRVQKETNSAFSGRKGRDFSERLHKCGITTLYLMGINSNYCVKDTAAGAIKNGFRVVSHDDVIDTWTTDGQMDAISWFEDNGALMPFNALLDQLVRAPESREKKLIQIAHSIYA